MTTLAEIVAQRTAMVGEKWFCVRIVGVVPVGSTEEQATHTLNRDINCALGLMEFVKMTGTTFHTREQIQQMMMQLQSGPKSV